MFVDASAMIAMIVGEPDADDFADRLDPEERRLCSAVSAWETMAGLVRSYTYSVESARATVRSFLRHHGFQFVAIAEPAFDLAAEAYAQFGKGRHPAALNMGDCLAYACAKDNRARLLFKGDDFRKTDIAAG